MKRGFLALFSFLLCSLSVAAQDNTKTVSAKTPQEKMDLCKEVENTYQIIGYNERISLAITSDVCEIVKRERKKDKTIIYKVNELYSIKIYSEKDIPTLKLPLQYIIYNVN